MSEIERISLQDELKRLVAEEDERRKIHSHCKGNLQEAWDKLVHLRSHIKLFHTAIEEATIEIVASQTESNTWSSSTTLRDNGGSYTDASASRASETILRDKVRLKEMLRGRLAAAEENVSELHQKLADLSEGLTKLLNRNGDQLSNTTNNLIANESDNATFSDSIAIYLHKRREILALSNELEHAEDSVARIKTELHIVENELTETLRRATLGISTEPTDAIATLLDESIPSSNARANDAPLSLIQVSSTVEGEGGSEFTLHEVLAGKARIRRLNGESARKFKDRLTKRLLSLTTLDTQLQSELDFLADQVRRARDDLQTVELKRLRVELALSKLDSAPSVEKRANDPALHPELTNSNTSLTIGFQPSGSSGHGTLHMRYHKSHPFDASASVEGDSVSENESLLPKSLSWHKSVESPVHSALAARLRRDLFGDLSEPQSESKSEHGDDVSSLAAVVNGARPALLGGPITSPSSMVKSDTPKATESTPQNMQPKPHVGGTTQRKKSRQAVADLVNRLENVAENLEKQQFGAKGTGPSPSPLKPSRQSPTKTGAMQASERDKLMQMLEEQRIELQKLREMQEAQLQLMADRSSNWSPRQSRSLKSDNGDHERSARSMSPVTPSSSKVAFGSTIGVRDKGRSRSESPHLRSQSDKPSPFYRIEERFRRRAVDSIDAMIEEPAEEDEKPVMSANISDSVQGIPEQKEQGTNESPPRELAEPTPLSAGMKSSPLTAPVQPLPQHIVELGQSKSMLTVNILGEITAKGGPIESSISLKNKLKRYQQLLAEAEAHEHLDPNAGMAVSQVGGEPLAFLNLMILEAKSIPKAKRLSQSSDPFIDIALVKPNLQPGLDDRTGGQKHRQQSAVVLPEVAELHTRTSIKADDLYPEWRESFKLAPIINWDSSVRFILKDASRSGATKDEDIGVTYLPLGILRDQAKHRLQLSFQLPGVSMYGSAVKSRKPFIRLPEQCHLKVEAQLTYSKVRLYMEKIDELIKLIQASNSPGATIPQSLDPTKSKTTLNDHKTSSPHALLTTPTQPTSGSNSKGDTSQSSTSKSVKAFQIVGLREAGKGALSDIRVSSFSHSEVDSKPAKGKPSSRQVSSPARVSNESEIKFSSDLSTSLGTLDMKEYMAQRGRPVIGKTTEGKQAKGGVSGPKRSAVSPPRRQTASNQQTSSQPQPQSVIEQRLRSGSGSLFTEEMKERKSTAAAGGVSSMSSADVSLTLVAQSQKQVANLDLFKGIRPKRP